MYTPSTVDTQLRLTLLPLLLSPIYPICVEAYYY